MSQGTWVAGLCAAVAWLCGVPATAAAAPKLPFGHAGAFVTDATGRVFITHGVNMVYKVPPYDPATPGFGDDDAAFLAREGFNSVRLGIIYKAVEPQPGSYDDAYLAKIARTAALLSKHGVTPLLDFHQDMYNERFQGEGWPDWAVIDDGAPAQPQAGFPGNYIVQPGLNRAFDNFWANTPGPGDVGLVDRYAAAWRHVAERFAGDEGVLGYDLLNEPWPGTGWQQCANPAGCPAFDRGTFAEFYRRTLAALRAGDSAHLAFYEPNVIFNDGADTQLPDFDDKQLGMSWHNYCLVGDVSGSGGGGGDACNTEELLPFQNARKRAEATGDTTLLTEFGATDDLDTLARVVTRADEFMSGWQYWAYCGCSDPTTQGPGETQAIVKDPAKPPTGSNLKTEKLGVLVRPYPQLIAGTPKSWRYDADAKRLDLTYSTARAGGGSFRGPPLTEIFVPERQYPSGYVTRVRGGAIASAPGAQTLVVEPCAGVREVEVTVTKTGQSSADCAAFRVAGVKAGLTQLKLSVRPRRVKARRLVRFRFRVFTGRIAIHDARIRFAGHSTRTDENGRATIRVRLRRVGVRRAIAWKRTFRHGTARVRVHR
jgi:endoglycosylceramidase